METPVESATPQPPAEGLENPRGTVKEWLKSAEREVRKASDRLKATVGVAVHYNYAKPQEMGSALAESLDKMADAILYYRTQVF